MEACQSVGEKDSSTLKLIANQRQGTLFSNNNKYKKISLVVTFQNNAEN